MVAASYFRREEPNVLSIIPEDNFSSTHNREALLAPYEKQ